MKAKYLATFSLAMFVMATITSCKKAPTSEEQRADELLQSANEAIAAGNGDLAIELLDSVDTGYSVNSSIKRQSLELRPKAILLQAKLQLQLVEDSITMYNAKLDSVAKLMTHIDIAGTEGYFVAKSDASKGAVIATTGVLPRVDETGCFYLVSSVVGAGNLHHTSLSFSVGDEMATTDTIPYDGDINYRISGSEMINFIPKRVERIADLLRRHGDDETVTVKFIGERGGSKMITRKVKDFSTPLAYSGLINDTRRLTLERERLNERIRLAEEKISSNTPSK